MSVFDRFRLRRRSPQAVGSLSCSELVEVITDYLEGSLSAADRTRFEAHLDICPGCRVYLDQMRMTIRATGRLGEESISGKSRDALLAAFRAWKQR